MPKVAKEMSALEVKRITVAGLHAVGGAPGLHLQVNNNGISKSWIMRTMISGRRRDVGLGSFPEIPLARAREDARTVRLQIRSGIDPIQARKEARRKLLAEKSKMISFKECAIQYIESKKQEWKNEKHKQQWHNTLETYANPIIGNVVISDIELSHICKILEPIWHTKPETASRVRGRLESILAWAIVRGYREGENPARWRNHLDKLFSRRTKIQAVKHHEAIPVKEIGNLVTQVHEKPGVSARALEFTILTAARSGEVLGARWSEIDTKKRIWTIPASRMKSRREHRVPLSARAMEVLNAAPRYVGVDYVFSGAHGKTLSNMAMLSVLRKMDYTVVTHGFRSTFRDWCAECTSYPSEIAEMALAHVIENKVEAAYRRGDLFEKRRELMDDWATHCYARQDIATVIPLKRRKKA